MDDRPANAGASGGAPGNGALRDANEQLVLALLKAQAELALARDPGNLEHRAAGRLQRVVRKADVVSRHGGDEFVVLRATSRVVAPSRALQYIVPQGAALSQELRQAQLQEANEHLLLAVLGARELQEAAERTHGDQTAFLAVVAHELRNPLTPIRTAAMLLDRVAAAELPRLRAVIERQVEHIARLIEDLLDVSRFNTGKLRLRRRTVDLCTLVPEALDACRPMMDARRQTLHVEACPGGLLVDGDPVRLVQLLSNLLDNASKYTPDQGAISLTLERAGAELVLTVADNGIGIRAEALSDVFRAFVQDSHATEFHSAGLGIGLTVVRELVEAHGGRVEAFSEGVGRGSRFVVTMPLLA